MTAFVVVMSASMLGAPRVGHNEPTGHVISRPSDPGNIESWAQRMGISARTLSRLVSRETGMSFGRWRRQLHILLALQWMARGATVQHVAEGLGYENASNFVVMFRKILGETPGRYLKSNA
ncbi:helix-turn-helix domain-containing protein [Janthinobacterium sp. BJB401]|uniref:helix-turn-helix domain-containing protein n=1 Tax=Janthinobacterium sp. BJB401 TaxID=2745934 RepID=UPI0034E97CCF